MKKTTILIAIAMSLFLLGCGTPIRGGFSKPTIFTIPPSYLDSFPLSQVTEESLINNLGLPDKTSNFKGKTYYSYELGRGQGKRQYVYEITDGIVTDVRYHDQGPYNGSSAKQRQGY